MALKSNPNLVWIAEYFVFQERVSISVGSSLHANANQIQITNFEPLRSAILATVEAKIVFDSSIFSNLKRFELQKTISCFIST